MQEVEQYIYQFLQYIRLFNSYLNREYNIQGFPTYNEAGRVFPRMGEFNFEEKVFKYHYHGSGCTLLVDDVIVDYDIDILRNNKVRISDWKFNRFVESYSKGISTVLIDDLNSIFVKLVAKGVLDRKEPDRFVFLIHEDYFDE
jgi:hypothetical protein